jgi:hypothetical protein
MSEPTSLPSPPSLPAVPAPALPSTADATPYAPVSWVAVAAAVTAAAFVAILLVFGFAAFRERKPLIEPGLLALPAVALVLCFAARRGVRDAEGTQTEVLSWGGSFRVNLIDTAWWAAVVPALVYGAYLFAIDYSIKREARAEATKWMDAVRGGTPDDLPRAFWFTLDAGGRQNIAQDDEDQMRVAFRDEYLGFGNCDLLRLAQRNPGGLTFAPGPVSWEYKPGALDCSVAGLVTCPEGTFPVSITMKGKSTPGVRGRQWMITAPQGSGYIDQARATRTAYGWLMGILEQTGGGFGKEFVQHLRGPLSNPYAYAGYAEYADTKLFRLRGNKDPNPELKAKFLRAWNELGLRRAGERLRTPDSEPVLRVTETAVEVRIPIEIPVTEQSAGKVETARGLLVVTSADPGLLELVKRYREAADPARASPDVPADLAAEFRQRYADPRTPDRLLFPWRVSHVESNLEPVVAAARPGPGGPGGPGGGSPPGMPGGMPKLNQTGALKGKR